MKNNKQGGLVKMIILIVIAIAVLSYFGVDIKAFFTSEQFQRNLVYVWNFLTDLWTNYLMIPTTKVWGILTQYVWTPLTAMFSK